MIYLAAPIDRSKNLDNPQHGLIDELRKGDLRGPIFVPKSSFDLKLDEMTREDIKAVVDINRHALESSSLMIMHYIPGVESWGCPQELLFAWSALVPVILLVPATVTISTLPIYLRAWVEPANIVQSIPELISLAKSLLSKPVVIPAKRSMVQIREQ